MAEGKQHGPAPSQMQLVFRRHPQTGEAVEGQLRWGFIPPTALTLPTIEPIHVRAETITEKPMFANAYRERRCIVPMNSYLQKLIQRQIRKRSRSESAAAHARST